VTEALTRSPGAFAHRLSPSDRDELIAAGRFRRYSKGASVFLEGDPGDFVLLIIEGRAKIVASTAEGSESLLSIRGPGDLVGELAAIDAASARRMASMIALDPLACRILRADEFMDFLEHHPAAALELLRVVAGRLRDAERRRVEFGAYGSTRRLARLLIDLAENRGASSDGALDLGTGLSQQEMAGLIGTSRESVARALHVLRGEGLLATGRRSLTVLDLDRLRSYAG
jgi:CRP-like cAMP-binding protein